MEPERHLSFELGDEFDALEAIFGLFDPEVNLDGAFSVLQSASPTKWMIKIPVGVTLVATISPGYPAVPLEPEVLFRGPECGAGEETPRWATRSLIPILLQKAKEVADTCARDGEPAVFAVCEALSELVPKLETDDRRKQYGPKLPPLLQGLQQSGQQPELMDFQVWLDSAKKSVKQSCEKAFPNRNIEIELVMEPDQFEIHAKRAAKGSYHPLLTWHGTTQANISKIVEHGYVAANDLREDTGEIVPMAHGNIYGDGVYTSVFKNLAGCFADTDRHGSMMMLANSVIVGKSFVDLSPENQNLNRLVHVSGKTVAVKVIDKEKADDKQGWSYDTDSRRWNVSTDGFQFESSQKCDTLFHSGIGIVVSTEATDVQPLFKVSILPIRPNTKIAGMTVSSSSSGVFGTELAPDLFVLHDPKPCIRAEDADSKSAKTMHLALALGSGSSLGTNTSHHIGSYLASLNSNLHDVWVGQLSENITQWRKVTTAEAAEGLIINSLRSNMSSIGLADAVRAVVEKLNGLESLNSEGFPQTVNTLVTSGTVQQLLAVDSSVAKPSCIVVYIFVHDTKSCEGRLGEMALEIAENFRRISSAYPLVIKPICLTKLSDSAERVLIGVKSTMQAWCMHWEKHYCNIVDDSESLTRTFSQVYKEVTAQDSRSRQTTNWSVPDEIARIGEGLVSSFTDHPQWNFASSGPVLYHGIAPRYIVVDHIRREIHSAKPKDMGWDEVQDVGHVIVGLLNKFRNLIAGNELRFNRFVTRAVHVSRSALKVLDLALTNTAKDPLTLRSSLSDIRGFYFSLQAALSEIALFGGTTLSGKFLDRLADMKYRKAVARRADQFQQYLFEDKLENLQGQSSDEMAKYYLDRLTKEVSTLYGCKPEKLHIAGIEDILILARITGIGIRVHQSAAAEVEPWQLVVSYVSQYARINSNSLYMKNEFDILPTNADKKVTDVLPDDEMPPMLSRIVNAYTFTRTPHLALATQATALLVISWSSAVESLFRLTAKKIVVNMKEAEDLAKVCIGLTNRVLTAVEKWGYAKDLISRLMTNQEFEKYLTESEGTLSVCMALASFIRRDAADLFNGTRYNRLAFALVAEAVMRSCRVQLRNGKASRDATFYIRQALGFGTNGNVEASNPVIDYSISTKLTGKLLRNRRLTNCSAFAIVGILEMLEFRMRTPSSFEDATQLANFFLKPEVSMKFFLHKHLGKSVSGREVQLALYLEGMKHHKAKQRQNISFTEPASNIISAHWNEQAELSASRLAALQRAKVRAVTSRKNLISRAIQQAEMHKFPIIFSLEEVRRLNAFRPQSDQLELMDSGLLRHHCCYPNCPQFLRNVSSAADRVHGSRHGIAAHLSHMQILETCIPSLHSVGVSYASRTLVETFIERMRKRFPQHTFDDSSIYHSSKELEIIWAQSQNTDVDCTLSEESAYFLVTRRCVMADHVAFWKLASEIVNSDNFSDFENVLRRLDSRDSALYNIIEDNLLNLGKGIPPYFTEKIFLCATGRNITSRGLHTSIVWDAGVQPPARVERYVMALTGHSRSTLKQHIHDYRCHNPRHVYRAGELPNRRGHSILNPSYWALGYDSMLQFQVVAPDNVVEEYFKKQELLRVTRIAKRKGIHLS